MKREKILLNAGMGRNRSEGRNEGLDSGAHPGVAERGPGSSSLLSLLWGMGGVGLEPLIPLRVGGELRPNLGLACVDRGGLRLASSVRLSAFRVSMLKNLVQKSAEVLEP